MAIAIRRFEPADLQPVYSLYEIVFGPEPLKRLKQRWQWQFVDNPAAHLASPLQWVAESGGEVLAYMGSFPMRMKILQREFIVHFECDLIVSPEGRDRDPTMVFRLLRVATSDPEHILSSALGYSPQHGELRKWMEHHPLHIVPVYMRPIDAIAMLRYMKSRDQLPKLLTSDLATRVLGAALNAGIRPVNALRRPPTTPEIEIRPLTEAGEEFTTLWKNLAPRFPIIAIRDQTYVGWRFFDDPVYHHVVLGAYDARGNLNGYLAYRMSENRGLRIGRIMDLFCDPHDEASVSTLLRSALEGLEREGAHVVSCLGLHPTLRRVVRRSLYLAPPQYDEPAFIQWSGEPEMASAIYQEQNWHLAHADGDEGFAP